MKISVLGLIVVVGAMAGFAGSAYSGTQNPASVSSPSKVAISSKPSVLSKSDMRKIRGAGGRTCTAVVCNNTNTCSWNTGPAIPCAPTYSGPYGVTTTYTSHYQCEDGYIWTESTCDDSTYQATCSTTSYWQTKSNGCNFAGLICSQSSPVYICGL